MKHDKKNDSGNHHSGPWIRNRDSDSANSNAILLLRHEIRYALVLAGITSVALVYATVPVAKADNFQTLYEQATVTGTYDNGENNFTQQHQSSIRNVQFSNSDYVCSIKLLGASYAGTPTDSLRITLYSKATSFANGDVTVGTLVTSSTISAANVIAGNTTATFTNCFQPTSGYYYGILIQRTGAESDTNFYKIGYGDTGTTNLGIFSAGSWNDATPSPKMGSVAFYGLTNLTIQNYWLSTSTAINIGTSTDCYGTVDASSTFASVAMKNFTCFFFVPTTGLTWFNQRLNNFQNTFPFSLLFGFNSLIQSELANATSTISNLVFPSLTATGTPTVITVFTSSTLANVIGSSAKTLWFDFQKYLAWVIMGWLAVKMMLHKKK